MKKRIEAVKMKCEEAIKRIDDILSESEEEKKYGLSDDILLKIKGEIINMKKTLDKSKYKPIYGIFISDYQFADEKLLNYLLDVSVFYKKYT
ncbi:MAG: hypothetical protein Q4D53_07315 [Leptotrichiaceae bacterium]|nr:hypothetical protein [Leptotrichiaceae bacterium]